jgi:hypothetical protein
LNLGAFTPPSLMNLRGAKTGFGKVRDAPTFGNEAQDGGS